MWFFAFIGWGFLGVRVTKLSSYHHVVVVHLAEVQHV